MTYRSEQRWQRVMALMLTLMLLLTGYTVPAQAEDWQNLSITLSWTDGAGNPASAMATPVAWSEDRAYWVRVTPEAMAQGMTLTVSDPSGQYTYTTPYGDVLTGVMDAGSAMDSTVMPVEVTAYDGAGNAVAVYHLYVSTQADVPEEPKAEPATAEVQVVYQTVDGIQLGSTTKHCVEGESNEVYAAEIDGYTLAADYSAAVQYVTVNSDGTASPNPVIFYYNAVQVEPATAEVTVQYMTVDGMLLSSQTQWCTEGQSNEVYAAELDGYTLATDYSAAVQYVTVNSDGTASPNPVIFYYNAVQAEPATAEVTVQYMTVDGMLLSSQTQWCTEGQSNEVYAAEIDGYTLATEYSPAVQSVTVNSDGTASPNPVIFYYNAVQTAPATAEVQVQYMTVDGMLLSSQTQWCTEGQSNEVYAAELDGYTLATDYSAAVQYVTVNSDGTASPNPVVFYYNPVQAEPIPVSATVNVSYVGEDGREVAPSDTITYTANGSYTITAAQAGVDSNLLELISDHEVTVTVTDGVAQPAQVKFVYREKQLPIEPEQPVEPELPVPPTPATIQVYYRNQENQNIAAAQTMTLAGGQTTTVSPERSLVPEGYDADSAQSVTVTVSNEGVATPAEVVFTFARTAVPDVPVPQGEMINRFGTINDAKVAMRTSMDSSGNGNLVSRLKKGTVVYLLREEINDKGQSWTRILMDGQQYFIMTKFIDMMTKADSDAYMAEHYPDNPIPPMTEADLDGGAEPAPQPVTVDVTVRYVTEDGVELDRQTVSVTSDQPMTVTPASDKVAGYVLTSASSVQVTVDAANGTATPSEVVFTYREPEPEVKTAEVKVFYITEDGMELDSQTIVCASDKATIITPTSGKTEGYALVSAGSVEVTVNPQTGAASPSEVSFIYRALPPAEVTVDVTVRYVTEDGVELDRQTTPASSAQAVTITPASDKVAGYVLTSASSVQVTVDAATGAATPSEVVFTYREPEPEVKTAEVKVLYVTEDGMELDSQTIVCASDKATIITPTSGKTEGYALVSAGSVEVTVDQQTGAASQSEVRFTYRVLPPATVTVDVPVIYVTEDGAELDRQTITCTSAVPTNIMPTSTKVAGYTLTSASSVQVTVDAATGAADPAEVRFTYARPAQYEGYALTTQAVALRTEISTSDASIIRALSKDTLVYVYGQQYDSSNQAWSTVSTLDEQPGMVLDSALRRITKEEAQYYITLWEEQNQPENTPEPTATPPQVAGKAVTIGDGVMFRQTYDATGAIIAVLPKDTEVEVLGQAYTANGEAWHSVRYSGSLGYIRADMLRFVTNTDAPATTQPTVNPDGLSAYGYVSSSTVNFRKSASTSASRLRVLKQYAMCLVLGTEQVGDTTWYHVKYDNQEGYIAGDYFKHMTISEVNSFLSSDEYRQGVLNNATANNNQDNTGSLVNGGVVSEEDKKVDEWTNPNSGLNVSYEPFDPFATVAPIATETPNPFATEEPSELPTATATLELLPTIDINDPAENQGGNAAVGWIITIIILALGGGGVYAYVLYTQNKRRAAQRAAQRRAQAAQQQRANAQQQRPAQPNQPRTGTYTNQAGAARPTGYPQSQAGQPYSPGQLSGQRPSGQPQAGQPYTAGQPSGQRPNGQPQAGQQPQQGASAYQRTPGQATMTSPTHATMARPTQGMEGSQSYTAQRPGQTAEQASPYSRPTEQANTGSQPYTAQRPGQTAEQASPYSRPTEQASTDSQSSAAQRPGRRQYRSQRNGGTYSEHPSTDSEHGKPDAGRDDMT